MLMLSSASVSQASAPAPGVAQTLARERAAQIHNLRYTINAALDADATALQGSLAIRVEVKEAAAVTLDYRPPSEARASEWMINGTAFEAVISNDHVVLAAGLIKAGANEVLLRFSAPVTPSGGALTRYTDQLDGARYVYSLFVPSDASTMFPCFDQPDLKAVWSLSLTVPQHWRAVSNGPLRGLFAKDGVMRLDFGDTRPLPTYLFAFAAGPFAQISRAPNSGAEGKQIRWQWARIAEIETHHAVFRKETTQ